MKVLIVNYTPIENGFGVYAQILHNALGHDAEMISFPNQYYFDQGTFVGTVVKPATRFSMFNVLARRFVNPYEFRYIENFEGIVHHTAHYMPPIGSDNRSKVVGTIHDFLPFEDPASYKLSLRVYISHNIKRMLKLPNIILTTEYMKTKLAEFRYSGNVYVVPHCYSRYFKSIDIDSRHLPFEKDKGINYVLSVSTNMHYKNLRILPTVMQILKDKYRLVRVGSNVGNSITFKNCSQELLNQIYNYCDVMVYPSLTEGFGRPLIEAFAVGLPVAAADIPTFREIGGDAVEYFDPEKPEEAAEAIIRIINNKEYYVQKSLKKAKLYNHEVFSKNMKKVYATIENNS